MAQKKETTSKDIPWFGIGIVVSCCLIPLMPLFFGIGGVWISTLTPMETLRLFFLIPALLFIGLGYRKLYLLPDNCEEGQSSVSAEVKQKQKILFWIGSILILLLLVLA